MIISNISEIPSTDVSSYCWAGMRRFHNISFVTDFLCNLHNIPQSQKQNARKQSEQIRYCLMQAREYHLAASVVSLATKPLLLYYSAMSLAFAEILLKQDGNSSLDKARAEHNHHGLVLRVDRTSGNDQLITATGAALRAVPLVHSTGRRLGTFELWHRTCREMPITGDIITDYLNGTTSTHHNVIFTANDWKLDPLPSGGISFLDCAKHLHGMTAILETYGVKSPIVRAKVTIKKKANSLNIAPVEESPKLRSN